ncbi:ribosome-inactivating protein bryodin II-like [Pyrus x bretschneideri]|uniref:ribosome-inactivating protein bryodin II-like n=1 Tax=Pyrus x bretschneideri TaxID=225117 RepID=UPI00203026AE|nr:ribosome-inactivating protein bryodin II-like [Pyrus x bretschneideri]
MALALSLLKATPKTYTAFIEALRARLTAGRPTSHGIPVLPRIKDVPDAQRFLYVDLTNYNGDTIRVAIDVVNVYVVGYRSGNKSYILANDAKKPAPTHTLFPTALGATQSTRTLLPFTGDYPELGPHARRTAQSSASGALGSRIHENIPMLEQIPLGRNELDNAISKLHYAASHSDQAAAFIVIIQMVSEAARFRYIESQVGTRMGIDNPPYIPDPAMRSLENEWSALSEQVQNVPANGNRFSRSIQLTTVNYRPLLVDSVEADMVQRRGIVKLPNAS